MQIKKKTGISKQSTFAQYGGMAMKIVFCIYFTV